MFLSDLQRVRKRSGTAYALNRAENSRRRGSKCLLTSVSGGRIVHSARRNDACLAQCGTVKTSIWLTRMVTPSLATASPTAASRNRASSGYAPPMRNLRGRIPSPDNLGHRVTLTLNAGKSLPHRPRLLLKIQDKGRSESSGHSRDQSGVCDTARIHSSISASTQTAHLGPSDRDLGNRPSLIRW